MAAGPALLRPSAARPIPKLNMLSLGSQRFTHTGIRGNRLPRGFVPPSGSTYTTALASQTCGAIYCICNRATIFMKITNVRAIQLERPLARPQGNSCGIRHQRRFTFVLVETDAGLTGLGDAYGDQALMLPIIQNRLAGMACGLDPTNIAAVWKKLFASRSIWEIGGSFLCGISAIEVACWDIWAQAEGIPLYDLLGGAQRQQVEAYASDLHWDEPNYMAETAARYVEDGFRYVKTHVGYPGEYDRDLKRLAAVRKAIGSDVGFMIDINTAFDLETALRFGRDIVDIQPFWYEEPLCPLDFVGHAQLRAKLPYPIATGENLFTTHGFEPLWPAAACDYVMPDILRCGGLEQTRRICKAAVQAGIVPTLHNYSSGVGLAATMHLMAAHPTTQLLEFDPTGTAIYEELFVEPLEVANGYVSVPQTPGLGVRLTEQIVERYRLK